MIQRQDEMIDGILDLVSDPAGLDLIRFMVNEKTSQFRRFMNENRDLISDRAGMLGKASKLHKQDQEMVAKDAWSSGQLNSKLWLINILNGLDLDLGNVWVLCGWIGSLPMLMHHYAHPIRYASIRSFDIDPRCAGLAETLNRQMVRDGWRFKATTMDVNLLRYVDFEYETVRYDGSRQTLCESPDTIVNTSCEHLESDEWFRNIPEGRLVILQSNDFLDHGDHANPVLSLEEMISRYAISEIIFSGELDCQLYRRFMLIGRK